MIVSELLCWSLEASLLVHHCVRLELTLMTTMKLLVAGVSSVVYVDGVAGEGAVALGHRRHSPPATTLPQHLVDGLATLELLHHC